MPQRQARQYARRPQVWRQVRLAGATAVSSAAGSLAGGAAVSTAAISGSKRRQLRCQVPRQVPWRQPNGDRQHKKITNSAQKPIFCALFYSQGRPISSTDAEFYSRRSTFPFMRPAPPASELKNPDFVLGKPENGGFRPQKRTKTSILCSKCPKTGVPEGKSAQKCRLCAREEGIGTRERGN